MTELSGQDLAQRFEHPLRRIRHFAMVPGRVRRYT